jgi:iron complex transport system ATP-binding protein
MAARGLTVIAVLHDLNLALRYADAALLLDHGRVAAAGPVAQVLHPASLEPVFGVRVEILAGAGGPVLATY